jgi:hypothetical protein
LAYCTTSDVTNEFKKLTLNDSTISTAKVTEWISQADAYIDGKVGLKYTTPVSGATESLKILKQISTWMVAGRVKQALDQDTGDDRLEQITKGDLEKKAKAMLQEIVDGKLLLSDATIRRSGDGVKSFAVDEEEEHTIKKGEDQW